jgi:hypothetical protein
MAAFTPGNLMLDRVGDGGASLSSADSGAKPILTESAHMARSSGSAQHFAPFRAMTTPFRAMTTPRAIRAVRRQPPASARSDATPVYRRSWRRPRA